MDKVLEHIGIKRRSGRYPWGSGGQPYQDDDNDYWNSNSQLVDYIKSLKDSGLSYNDIVKALKPSWGDIGVGEIKLRITIAREAKRAEDTAMAIRLKDKGYSNVAIGKRMGINESTVRSLLDPILIARAKITKTIAGLLAKAVAKWKWIDIGFATENRLGISRTKLKTAVLMLKDQGYVVTYHKVTQGSGKETSLMVLSNPGPTPSNMTEKEFMSAHWSTVNKNRFSIEMPKEYKPSKDGGETFEKQGPIQNIDSSRIAIRYKEDGGDKKDGVIELRRGVEDLNLGKSKYAQVRIAVEGTHYLKGMAIYNDNMPGGKDIIYNTSKSSSVPKYEVFKPMTTTIEGKIDPENPFGALIKLDNGRRGALNIVREEGDWKDWRDEISSQFVSKQSPEFAEKQLNNHYDSRQKEYDEIMRLTNPAVRMRLLKKFSDGADHSAVHLEAAKLPRSKWGVILPITDMNENEVYSPNHENGEQVALVRFPHGGIFEIPLLKVNNKQPTGKKVVGQAIDAIGIHPSVAEKLSGADFDGDTVLIIPTKSQKIKTHPSLDDLKDFNPREMYKKYEGMPVITEQAKGLEMGKVSNLITDMTIFGADFPEIARAVKHSMVVIDAYNHKLNYKLSEQENGIAALKKKYQGGATKGAATIVSKAKSPEYVDARREGKTTIIGPATDKTTKPWIDPVTGEKYQTKKIYIDPTTGKKLYEPTGDIYYPIDKEGRTEINPTTGKIKYLDRKDKPITRKTKTTKMAEADDAFTLTSGTDSKMEAVYATHANKLKKLANQARLDMINTVPRPYSKSARETYITEVRSLESKLNEAVKNAPLERRALLIADRLVKAKTDVYDLKPDQIKKLRGQAKDQGRKIAGAKKIEIYIEDSEWTAIQAGAISHSALVKILNNADLERVVSLATPKKELSRVSPGNIARARTMLNAGYTQSEVASALGMSLTTVQEILTS